MRPTLFSLPFGPHGLAVHTYGFAIAVGFALGVVVAARQARRVGLDTDAILDLLFWILVTGIAGSRLAYVLVHAPAYARLCAGTGAARPLGRLLADCAAPLRLWEGGLVFYGGALGAAATAAWFTRRRGWRFGQVADVLAPALALGHAVGRLGCFFAGCCYGKPWARGLVFPPGSVAADELAGGAAASPPLHPTQLYESAGELAIFFALLWARPRQRFHGATALLYALLYAVLRFVVEIFRGDAGRGFVLRLFTPRLAALLGVTTGGPLFLSTSQAIGAALAVAAGITLRRGRV